MVRVGVISEDDYDIKAFAALMKQKYRDGYQYLSISKHKTGDQIYTNTAIKSFNFEINKETPDLVVVMIDADASKNESEKIREKRQKYDKIAKGIGCKKVLLLNIYELEALILADIETFNLVYNVKIPAVGNVMHKENPKGFLRAKTEKTQKKYEVSHCPELFKKLRFDVVRKNCGYFNSFITEFEAAIQN